METGSTLGKARFVLEPQFRLLLHALVLRLVLSLARRLPRDRTVRSITVGYLSTLAMLGLSRRPTRTGNASDLGRAPTSAL